MTCTSRSSLVLFLGAACWLASCVTPMPPDLAAKAPALDDFGAPVQPITTSSPQAQRLYKQGVLQAYAFNEAEAVRAFKAALALDPACAMCAWGVAWQLGPNINAPLREDMTDMRRYAALARQNMPGASAREQGLIEAMSARYGGLGVSVRQVAPFAGDICGSPGATPADPLDIAYAAHMRELVERYPDDPDIASLYAEAVMIATNGDWWDRKTGVPAGQIGPMTQHLERVLQKSPSHTGLNHYLIHAVDASTAPQRATAAADRLGALAPLSPHLRHMPAHIYVRVARYGDAVRVNQVALQSELDLAALLKAQQFEVVKNWDSHNLHFLWFAALMDGRADLALATARRLAERAAKFNFSYAEYRRSLPVLTLLRLQRWPDVLAEPAPAANGSLERAVHAHARAVALARTGQLPQAREVGASAQAALEQLQRQSNPSDDDKFARGLLEVIVSWQQAELALASGDADAAQAAARRGVELEAALEDREPPMLAANSRLVLGQLMLDAKRWAAAEAAFREDLADQPGSGWAYRGLYLSLANAGKAAQAAPVKGQWQVAWSAADAALRAPPQ